MEKNSTARSAGETDRGLFILNELCDQIEEIEFGEKSSRQQAIEKIRRQKRRRSRRQRQRDVQLKRRHGEKKSLRRRPGSDD